MKTTAATIAIFLLMSTTALPKNPGAPEVPFVSPQVTARTDIHFNARYCSECHAGSSGSTVTRKLRYGDYETTCRCHTRLPRPHTHPVGITPSSAMLERMPPDLPLVGGRITCNTCHAVAAQCSTIFSYSSAGNRQFLRTDTSLPRTAFCYKCHDQTEYRKLNPHQQLDEGGGIIEAKCLYCHKSKPDEKNATLKKQRSGSPGTVEFVAGFSTLCFRCHFRQTKQHVVSTNHLKPPPPDILDRKRYSEKMLWVILPLDDSGSVTCATCHNPHQRGIIPSDSPASWGADEKARLRVPFKRNRICKACHEKRT